VEITGREFEAVAEHAGLAYLRYSFTRGSEQEVRFLMQALGLEPGMTVLDVGCGPGRHCHALGRYGVDSVGVDISHAFLAAAGQGRWVRADARRLPLCPRSFDAAVSLCQGGFGLLGGRSDALVLGQMAESVKEGGRIAFTAFSAYFAVRYLEDGDTFDADAGVNHEKAAVRSPEGTAAEFDLWTTCFTPRELRLMAADSGISELGLWSVTPGAYGPNRPDIDQPEFLFVGEV
jgi:SAM-dependent methyltransferase